MPRAFSGQAGRSNSTTRPRPCSRPRPRRAHRRGAAAVRGQCRLDRGRPSRPMCAPLPSGPGSSSARWRSRLRAALTGRTTSPPIFDVLAVLGRDESLARLRDQAADLDSALAILAVAAAYGSASLQARHLAAHTGWTTQSSRNRARPAARSGHKLTRDSSPPNRGLDHGRQDRRQKPRPAR